MSKSTKSTNGLKWEGMKGDAIPTGAVKEEGKINSDSRPAIAKRLAQRHIPADNAVKRGKRKQQLKPVNAFCGADLIAFESKEILLLFKENLDVPSVLIVP